MRIRFGVLLLLAQWVICSDAWFWFRTGTTTLPPAVEQEGSGSPAGSGEPPSESSESVGAEIIEEELGIHKVGQTWAETTKAPELTTIPPSVPPESEKASEKTTPGISSYTSKPGNGTSSLKGMDSGESESESDLGSGLLLSSESDFIAGNEKSLGSGKEADISIHYGFLDRGASGGSTKKEKKLKKTFPARADEDQNLKNTKSEASLNSASKTPNNNENNTNNSSRNDFSLTFYKTPEDFMPLTLNNSFTQAAAVPQRNQQLQDSQMSNEDILPNMLNTEQMPVLNQTISITETPTQTYKQFIAQSKTHNNRPESNSAPTETQLQISGEMLVTREKALTGQTAEVLAATPPSLLSQTAVGTQSTTENHTEVKSKQDIESSKCLLIDTALPFCFSMEGKMFTVPNYLNQSSMEEVQTLLNEWVWLLQSRCHPSLERFFCLLLVPKCGTVVAPPVLPCQSFCEVLRDSCWMLLDEGHLPVECHSLPDEEDEGSQCLSVSNQKGNHCFEMKPNLVSFGNRFEHF